MKRLLVAVVLSCLVVQTGAFAQSSQRPAVQTPSVFRADPASQPGKQVLADLKWFDLFQDQKLQDLIRDALTNNYDLRQAIANINAARATLGITRSEQFPTIKATSKTFHC